jgi:hypothetical protein
LDLMFDAQITAAGMDVLTPTPNEDGSMPEGPLTLAVAVALLLPTPQGPMPLQAGIIRIPFAANVARDLAAQLIEAADKMPEPAKQSDLVVATPGDMANVAKQADAATSLKGNTKAKPKHK